MRAFDEPMRDARTWDFTGRAGGVLALFAMRLSDSSRRELALRSELGVPLREKRSWSKTWEERLAEGL